MEYKICVLGQAGWGKTTMINYFNNVKPQLLSDKEILYKPSTNIVETTINICGVNLKFIDFPGDKKVLNKLDLKVYKQADIHLIFRWYDCIDHVFYEDLVTERDKIVYLMDYNYFYNTEIHHKEILDNILEMCKNLGKGKNIKKIIY